MDSSTEERKYNLKRLQVNAKRLSQTFDDNYTDNGDTKMVQVKCEPHSVDFELPEVKHEPDWRDFSENLHTQNFEFIKCEPGTDVTEGEVLHTENFEPLEVKREPDDDCIEEQLTSEIVIKEECVEADCSIQTPFDVTVQREAVQTVSNVKQFRGSVRSYQRSNRSHCEVKMFECKTCGLKFKYSWDLESHEPKHIGPYKCQVCAARFNSNQSLKDHLKMHPNQYKCDICSRDFKYEYELLLHKQLHSGLLQIFVCSECDKTYEKKGELIHHIQEFHCNVKSQLKNSNTGNNKSPKIGELNLTVAKMPCECKREIQCKSAQPELHTTNLYCDGRETLTYIEVKPEECTKCKRWTLIKNNITVDNTVKLFVCKICHKTFQTKSKLSNHSYKVHTISRPFKCDKCSKGFKNKSSLTAHIVVHTDLRPFKCTVCGKTFKQQITLMNHASVHSKLRPFSCDKCDKKFKSIIHLRSHIPMHKSYKPFVCKICSKSYNKRWLLLKHERVHNTAGVFSCDECSKTFKHLTSLKTHMKVHSQKKN